MSASPQAAATPEALVAAVDLGSNSFHLVVARANGRELQVVDRLKESVRLAAGLDDAQRLSTDARARALAALARFGKKLRHLPSGRVRAVGTDSLRRARDVQGFLVEAEQALGHPIEIIYGAEEARLIYGGVCQELVDAQRRRLVVDIGGGSTEIIAGEGESPCLLESVRLGAVTLSQRYFGDGRIDQDGWRAAVLEAREVLEPLVRAYRSAGWDIAVGASGSVRSVRRVGRAAGWCDDGITRDALTRVGEALVAAGHIDALDLSGLSNKRRPIFAGGSAVLTAVFDSFGLDRMQVSKNALREGLVLDLLARLEDQDVRETTVAAAAGQYGVDRVHGERVAATAERLLSEVPDWAAPPRTAPRLLTWAALLHEIGLGISRKGYHKHGAYIAWHTDLQGFSRNDQAVLAALLRLHRGKFRRDLLADIPEADWEMVLRLAVILRLAVLLHRGRETVDHPPATLAADGDRLRLTVDEAWLRAHPPTAAALEREAKTLAREGYDLIVGGP